MTDAARCPHGFLKLAVCPQCDPGVYERAAAQIQRRMAPKPAPECLPPDPATPGLWWLSTLADPVMRAWQPASRAWADTDGGRTAACSAHAARWRVWVAAVPPGGTS